MQISKDDFKSLSYEKIFEILQTNKEGLSSDEVLLRQKKFGLNEIPEKKESLILLFLKKFWGLTPWMLELTVILSIFLKHYIDAYFILALLLLNAVLSFYQEKKSSQAVEALKKQLAIKVRTLRDNKWQIINAKELTIGDIIRIRAGDFVPADCKLIDGSINIDQSSLTGESQLIQKSSNDILYSGSIVKNGECTAVIVFIGTNTYFGKTTELVELAKPRLNIENMITNIVKLLMVIVVGSLLVTFVVSYLRGENLLALLPLILILLVSAIPVALPAMFTVSMALGSQQLSKKGILITRLNASEDVAQMTTLCADKTGTITENRLSLNQVKSNADYTNNEILAFGALCSLEANHDPIDLAFINACKEKNIDLASYEQVNFMPFDQKLKRTQALVNFKGEQITITKGAFESVCLFCPIDEKIKDDFNQTVLSWAKKGYKTIAISIEKNSKSEFVGIVALYDPPRKDSNAFIKELRNLGVKIKMLTGDADPIALEIAKEVGIGENIARPEMIRNAIKTEPKKAYEIAVNANGFSEVLPEDKFYIVKSLQGGNEIVGMTGDGVNDAPALKQAEVGIAVSNATDIAKKAASVVLLKEGLGTIVDLIKMGRIIHHRVLNWIVNKIVKTFQTVVFVCIAYLITGKFVVSALDVVLLLFIIDFVTISFSTDNVRWSQIPEIFNIKPLVSISTIIGVLTIIESLFLLYIADKNFSIFSNAHLLHTFGFGILLFSNIFNVFVIRERGHFWESTPSKVLLFSMIMDFIIGILMIYFGIIVAKLPIELITLLIVYLLLVSMLNDFIKVALTKKH